MGKKTKESQVNAPSGSVKQIYFFRANESFNKLGIMNLVLEGVGDRHPIWAKYKFWNQIASIYLK